VVLPVDWKEVEFSVDGRLPASFLSSKLKADQQYISIGVYREIMRQTGEFWVPEFTDPEKFMSWNNSRGIPMVTYRVKCTVEWKRWDTVEILRWVWYSALSWWIMLSDAIHWNIATLDAKALRSALKHSYRIFEYPEKDSEYVEEKADIEEVAKEVKPVEEKKDVVKKEVAKVANRWP